LTVGILGGGVVAAAVLLWENVDVRQLAPSLAEPPPPPPTPEPGPDPVRPGARFEAALLNSPRNGAYFPDDGYYAAAVTGWKRLAEEAGAVVREVATAADLQALEPGEVLVVPEAPCLTNDELSAMRAHLARGGGVVANWAVGARDGLCQWRGFLPLMEFTGALDVREMETREALFLTVPEGLALSAGMPPGARIEVRGEPSLALRAEGTRAYWSDWALNPAPDESGGGADVGATVARSPGGGRVAWFAPRLNQAATPTDSLKLSTLIRNGILWAGGVPTAHAGTWPGGQRAAAVFAMEVESQAANAVGVARTLVEKGVPGTFFAVTQIVGDDEELGRVLLGAGEVGSQTSDHAPLAGRTAPAGKNCGGRSAWGPWPGRQWLPLAPVPQRRKLWPTYRRDWPYCCRMPRHARCCRRSRQRPWALA
jgi:hypothetical protein